MSWIEMTKAFKMSFWMMLHGSLSPKRTVCWSNDAELVAQLALCLYPARVAQEELHSSFGCIGDADFGCMRTWAH